MNTQKSQSVKTKDPDAGIQLRSAMLTDVGLVREHNEDSALINEDLRFFVVADGMGGHAAGEVASSMAVAGVRRHLSGAEAELATFVTPAGREDGIQIAEVLEGAVREAHRSVYERGIAEPDKHGMGTTLDVLLLVGQDAFIAHIGDSRTYLMRDGLAAQITADHTRAEVLVVQGQLTPAQALVSPMRNVLVNALGVAAEVGVEMAHLTLHEGDRLLLCSDGLHDYFPDEQELFEEVTKNAPEKALDLLIEAAKKRGGHDNITAILVEVLKAPDVEAPAMPMQVPAAGNDSDGVPRAIAVDETMPVGPPDSGFEGHSSDLPKDRRGKDSRGKDSRGAAQDLRATMPLQGRAGRARAQTEGGPVARLKTESPRFASDPTIDRKPSDDD